MPLELQKDSNGNIITCPVTGYVTATVADIAVLLCAEFAESQSDMDRGIFQQVQLLLMPQQALELAERLTIQAKRVLESSGESLM